MKILPITALLFIGIWTPVAQGKQVTARKKFVPINEFKKMTECSTGRSAWDYVGYGCWCGKGGSGPTLDNIDRCCKEHDHCYNRLVTSKTCYPYQWLYDIIWGYKRIGCAGCDPKNSGCGKGLCFCDRTAALCLKKYEYNPENYKVDKKKRCKTASRKRKTARKHHKKHHTKQ